MVAPQLLRFHGELPSLRFEGWRGRTAISQPETTQTSPHLIVSRSRPLQAVCPSPVYARLSKHVSGLWRWSLYRLVGYEEEQETQQSYDPQGLRAESGLTVEAEARIRELKRVLNVPEDRPPVLAVFDGLYGLNGVLEGALEGEIPEEVMEEVMSEVASLRSQRCLMAPFEPGEMGNPYESPGLRVTEGEITPSKNRTPETHIQEAGVPETPETPRETPPKVTPQTQAPEARLKTPFSPQKTSTHAPKTPTPKTPTPKTSTQLVNHTAKPQLHTPTPRTPTKDLGTPLKLKESVLRVPSPTEILVRTETFTPGRFDDALSPIQGQMSPDQGHKLSSGGIDESASPGRSPTRPVNQTLSIKQTLSTPFEQTLTPTRSPNDQKSSPVTQASPHTPENLRNNLKSSPRTPAKSIPTTPRTPHKSLPSPPSSPLERRIEVSQPDMEMQREDSGTSGKSPQQPMPLPMSPGRDVLSPGVPLTPGGTDATPMSPRTPLSPPAPSLVRSESPSELLVHVERFKSGSIRSLEAVQLSQQQQAEQESELARVFKRIRGRRAAIS
ncbi:hypothetical protein CJU89_0338 [Yarrowia sp. B02]|nr:hypothetical protein CJU89_0338 [Yarrowia sp. B02]